MAVKKMAGIAALEQVADEATAEIRQERAAIGDTERAIIDLEQHIAELTVDPSLLPRLEHERDDLHHRQERHAQHMVDLQAKTKHHQSLEKNITSAIAEFCHVKVDDSYQSWRRHVDRFRTSLDECAQQLSQDTTLTHLMGELKDFAHGATQRLSAFGDLRDGASGYRQRLGSQLDETTAAREQDQQASESLPVIQAQLQTRLNTVLRRHMRARLGVYTFLPLSLLGWVIWGLNIQMPTSGFVQTVSNWLPNPLWLPLAALLPSVLFLLCGLRSLILRSRIAQLKQAADDMNQQIVETHRQADALDLLDDTPLPQAVHTLVDIKDEAAADNAIRFQQGIGADLIEADQLDTYKAKLNGVKDHCVSGIKAQRDALADQIKTIQIDMTTCQDMFDQLCKRMGEEQGRHQTLNTLKAEISSRQDHMAGCKRRIQTRELVCDLSAHGAQHIATTFNRDIRDLVSRTLPLLTQGRYEHLKIDENLDVQVFSNQKRDFMKLEEISTGTQRQIMLAVRLALSQQFINTTLSRPQFIFLDEPFAFFDEPRTRSALQSLPKLSDELTQIWIVAQAFPEGFGFDLEIHCGQGSDVLSLSGS
jgi:DNA repair exonuclease SbcCD ATPase subunit